MSQPNNEYSTTPVAADALIHGARILLILLGLMIALPAFIIGAELSFAFGAARAISASILGGLILAVMAALSGYAGARSRLSTYMLIIDAFGTRGALLANGILGVALLGAFGVIAMMFGRALISSNPAFFQGISVNQVALFGCLLMIATTLVGIRALDLLSLITTPLKIGLLLWYCAVALGSDLDKVWGFIPAVATPLGTGVSMVAGALIIGATLMPDVCRFARTPMHAALACMIAFGLGFPLVLTLCGLPSLVTNEKDVVVVMLALGLGLPAMLVVLLTAWATNTFNLYSATLVIATLRPKQPRWHLVVLAGAIGTAFGLAGIDQKLMGYFLWLSIAIPPIAGVYLMNFYLKSWWAERRSQVAWRVDALAAWALGGGYAALMGHFGANITPVPALDSIIVSALSYAVFRWFEGGRRLNNAGQAC